MGAAAELPTIGESQVGVEEATPANLVAASRERRKITEREKLRTGERQTFGAGDIGQKILSALERLTQKIPAAVPQ